MFFKTIANPFLWICDKKSLWTVCLGKQLVVCSGYVMAMYISCIHNIYNYIYTSIYIEYVYNIVYSVYEYSCDVFVTLQGSIPTLEYFTNAWPCLIMHYLQNKTSIESLWHPQSYANSKLDLDGLFAYWSLKAINKLRHSSLFLWCLFWHNLLLISATHLLNKYLLLPLEILGTKKCK